MRQKVLISRRVFTETVTFVKEHFEVEYNETDVSYPPDVLIQKLKDKAGAITLLTDRIDEAVLSQCPDLKIVSNIAVGYNNIDVPACTLHKVMVTNTPGVLDDTTADSPGRCYLQQQGVLSRQINIYVPPNGPDGN